MQSNHQDEHELLRSVESSEVNEPPPVPVPAPIPLEPASPFSPPVPIITFSAPTSAYQDAYGRRMGIAILLSIAINFLLILLFVLIGSSNAGFLHFQKHKIKTPVEMVLIRKKVDPKPLEPLPKVHPRVFLETDPSQASTERPTDAKFYSEHNTLVTQTAPSPQKPGDLPKMDGTNVKTMNTETVTAVHKPSPPPSPQAPQKEQQNQPAVTPTQARNSKPAPMTIAKNSDLALLKEVPQKNEHPLTEEDVIREAQRKIIQSAPRAPPQVPNSAREVLAVKSKLEGGVPRVGKAYGFNSEQSPFASYDKKIISKIGQYWQYRVVDKFYGEKIGEVEVSFSILSSGKITDLQITHNTANAVLAGWCVQAIKESSPVDPFPESMKAIFGESREGTIVFSY